MRVGIVGPSFHFMSGMSVYTCRVANALAERHDVGVLLLDTLIPARFYPGGVRVGKPLAGLDYAPGVRRYGSLDWWWGLRVLGALARLRRHRPDFVVLQWWTAATLHTYLLLALVCRLLRIPVLIEYHEVQDTGEAGIPFIGSYARWLFPLLIRLSSGGIVHHDHDLEALRHTYGSVVDRDPVVTAPHGPYDHFDLEPHAEAAVLEDPDDPRHGVTRLLFFGTIRPYKGLEDLVTVFNELDDQEVAGLHLTVVGETWEGWTQPGELIEASPHRDRITFVNHYVTDDEAARFLAAADVMVLPARRGSASGPLQIAMSAGLHVVLYAVPGLVEAAKDYAGLTLVAPGDLAGLKEAILGIGERRRDRFEDPHSWDATVAAYEGIGNRLEPRE